MLTAQQALKEMLKKQVSPALRREGLRGSGGNYVMPSESHWVLIGFQRSTSSDASAVKFTVNCKVVRRDVWSHMQEERPYIGTTPSANIGAGSFEWYRRIGELMPEADDKWWWLRSEDDSALIATEVLEAIRTHALPVLRAEVERST